MTYYIDRLRQDILYNADDTPRYSTPSSKAVTGERQLRQCRSWARIEAWAPEHTACFSAVDGPNEGPVLNRFRYCPEGSKYIKEVEHVFGKRASRVCRYRPGDKVKGE